jgi:hypothetical protein
VLAQRTCKICGETFEIGGKRGRPRIYCRVCEPPGWQVVKVPHQTRVKLRRRRSRDLGGAYLALSSGRSYIDNSSPAQ